MSEVLRHLHENISNDLDRIAKRFKEPKKTKITLIVRNPHLDDGDVLVTNDSIEDAINAIRRLAERKKKNSGFTVEKTEKPA